MKFDRLDIVVFRLAAIFGLIYFAASILGGFYAWWGWKNSNTARAIEANSSGILNSVGSMFASLNGWFGDKLESDNENQGVWT